MGYTVSNRMIIEFDGTTLFPGAEVRCRSTANMDLALQFRRISDSEDVAHVVEQARMFAERVLLSWNLEDEDARPIPCNADTFADQDYRFVNAVIGRWVEHAMAVSPPLPLPSPAGPPSAEPEVTMVAW